MHAQQGLQYLVCVSVSVCVCYSTSHFSTCLFVPQTILTSVVDEGRKIFSERQARVLPVCKAYGYVIRRTYFTPGKTCMRMNLDHMASGHFVLGRDIHCEFDYWPLAVSMPPTRVCPQCKAAVPVRWKTCECCEHVFRSK